MYYKQSNKMRIYAEMILLFLAVFWVDMLFSLQLTTLQPSPFLFLILLFSLRYGWRAGIVSFGFILAYVTALEVMARGDVVVMLYKLLSNQWMFVYLFIAIFVGATRTAWKERYDDLYFVNDEQKKELQSAQRAVAQLKKTNEVLEQRLLQSEMSIGSVYGMIRALDQDNIEFVTNKAMSILTSYFKANDFGIYHADTSGRALRVKVRKGSQEALPQTIFLDEAERFYERLFTEKKLVVKRESDEAAAPVIAGPIVVNGEIRQVLIIQSMDFYQLTEHNIQLLHWLLRMISDALERAAAKALIKHRAKVYPHTLLYKKEFFDEYMQIEKQRFDMYKQPYACFDIFIGRPTAEQLVVMSDIIHKHLREVDKVGFDADTGKLLFLLPGTNQTYVEQLRERIVTKLQDEVGTIHGT
ncbi:hypothetical protein MUG87_17550 [Ectobacillus sp. JY-23]|uniref:hypothetical protein n=1 Tax=Ectobacillus sp. JY-23 TaxID=2933872 RepID=UPI001FF4C20A|nr:hypothetical protein [Ectobacillus sp. JY-23]UOY92216.1 hypothetical protein MUG87_17550 [Ectobacillus sp. JY-23]